MLTAQFPALAISNSTYLRDEDRGNSRMHLEMQVFDSLALSNNQLPYLIRPTGQSNVEHPCSYTLRVFQCNCWVSPTVCDSSRRPIPPSGYIRRGGVGYIREVNHHPRNSTRIYQ